MKAATFITLTLTLAIAALAQPATAATAEPPPQQDREPSAYQAMLEEAERARAEAGAARREAERVAASARETARRQAELQREESQLTERERERQRADMERIREELSRAHRELREATREVARAHSEVARASSDHAFMHEVNLGDRAVIGVILGPQSEQGVGIIGVSPDGPAERAGLQAGDTLLSLRGESLSRENGGREQIHRVMEEVQPGETLAVVVDRDGQTWNFDIVAERREPSSWQSLLEIPHAPDAPGAHSIIVERIEVPKIDEEALNRHIQELTEELQTRKFRFVLPDGLPVGPDGEPILPESFDVDILELSELAENALRETNIWFGLPQAGGLELATINEGLGAYFKTDRGVLVLEAREGNAYTLEAGDVVLSVDGRPVDTPADLMRALRVAEPGQPVELAIKRDRRDRTLKVTMPENRLGFAPRAPLPPHH